MTSADQSLTGALEDYLETIYLLIRSRGFARVRDIAKARGVKAGSVSPALRRLSELGLVDYAQREYIGLTEDGDRAARRVHSRHQILTRFFREVLRMEADSAEREACAIEHNLSDEGMDRMVRFFEYLHVCPRTPLGALEAFSACPVLSDEEHDADHACKNQQCKLRHSKEKTMSIRKLAPGERARVIQVKARGAIRQRLLDMGVLPNVLVEVERIAPTGDPIWIKLLGSQIALRGAEAEAIRVAVDR